MDIDQQEKITQLVIHSVHPTPKQYNVHKYLDVNDTYVISFEIFDEITSIKLVQIFYALNLYQFNHLPVDFSTYLQAKNKKRIIEYCTKWRIELSRSSNVTSISLYTSSKPNQNEYMKIIDNEHYFIILMPIEKKSSIVVDLLDVYSMLEHYYKQFRIEPERILDFILTNPYQSDFSNNIKLTDISTSWLGTIRCQCTCASEDTSCFLTMAGNLLLCLTFIFLIYKLLE